jgi:hypothetical protein
VDITQFSIDLFLTLKNLSQPWAAAFGPWEPIEKNQKPIPYHGYFSNEKKPMSWAGLGWFEPSPPGALTCEAVNSRSYFKWS